MSASVVCPGCRRRVRVPDGTDPRRSRCSKCRTRLLPVADDSYHAFAAATAPAPDPPAGPLSLDECEPVPAAGPPTVELPPPFKVPALVTGRHPLRGPVTAVLTPFGVFVERVPARPLAFAPVGTRAAADGRALRLDPPAGPLTLRFESATLAADAAAFLAGARPVPAPGEYSRPQWFVPAVALAVLTLVAVAFVAGVGLYVALRPAAPVEDPLPPPTPPAPGRVAGARPPGDPPGGRRP